LFFKGVHEGIALAGLNEIVPSSRYARRRQACRKSLLLSDEDSIPKLGRFYTEFIFFFILFCSSKKETKKEAFYEEFPGFYCREPAPKTSRQPLTSAS
tara:strand:+ start:112 stop:405 length:294 start_codon:yes stop_codon:yes gene_type:complete